ncbi:SMP-30/gluconolactonase/LRE family protein [Humisphaera borealis]|uniref:SMP-30/gluconolactonase/LRE family protein n=2 Tax=Humisphaera borealis TaxID=2807512 RepID=A0A7M2X453_9BACT|nr:SMP-30/gluconolactonase/LRE family protein [Humisphaera borealis]
MPGKLSSGTLGTIERLDPRLDKVLSQSAKMEKIVEGLDWAEGPVWDTKNNCLYFSDVPQNVVYKWDGKALTEHLRPSGFTGADPRGGEPGSNGLTLHNGSLYLCQHGDRRVAKWDAEGKAFVTVTAKYDGKRYNSPNDLCFDSKGNLFFTDPPYGLPKNVDDATKEIPYQGVYRVSPDGKVTLLTQEMTRPNGVALSPDEKTLYIAQSDPKLAIIKAFPMKDDGTLGEGKVLFDATAMVGKKKGLPDGLKVDKAGNLWATGPGGVLIIAADGTHLGTLATGEATANVAFGDDGSTLYICADMYIAKIRTDAKGW